MVPPAVERRHPARDHLYDAAVHVEPVRHHAARALPVGGGEEGDGRRTRRTDCEAGLRRRQQRHVRSHPEELPGEREGDYHHIQFIQYIMLADALTCGRCRRAVVVCCHLANNYASIIAKMH